MQRRDDEIRGENVRARRPEEVVVLEEMPRTATREVDRTGLKRMAADALHPAGGA